MAILDSLSLMPDGFATAVFSGSAADGLKKLGAARKSATRGSRADEGVRPTSSNLSPPSFSQTAGDIMNPRNFMHHHPQSRALHSHSHPQFTRRRLFSTVIQLGRASC